MEEGTVWSVYFCRIVPAAGFIVALNNTLVGCGPVPILPLPLDLSPNHRFCAFPQRVRVFQYLREQGEVLFFP